MEEPESYAPNHRVLPSELIRHFRLLAASPNGVARLRDCILTLAIQGRLVEQRSDEEPANILLRRLSNERWARLSRGEIDPNKPLLRFEGDAVPFDLPSGWEWVRLGAIATIERGGSPRPIQSFITDDPDGLNWIKIGDTEKGGKYITNCREKIRPEGLAKTRKVYPGDFLLTNSMSFGRPYITLIEGCIHDGWLRINPPEELNKDFLYLLLSSPFIRASLEAEAAGGVVMNLNAEKVRGLTLPVPPASEQSRIVTRVTDLMLLCDALEAKGRVEAALHARLFDILLDSLTDSRTPGELVANWGRIAQHFDVLLDRPGAVDALERTILQLAVRGLLVPQNGSDESASKLLERIATERDRLLVEGRLGKGKDVNGPADLEAPFDIPEGWQWVQFGDYVHELCTGPFGSLIHKDDYIEGGVPLVNPSHMVAGRIQHDSSVAVSQEMAAQLAAYQLAAGDVLIARRGEVGRYAMVTDREAGWLCGTGSFFVRLAGFCDREYFGLILQDPRFRTYLRGESVGATMINLNQRILLQAPIAIPPLPEQARIVARVAQLRRYCTDLRCRLASTQTAQSRLAEVLVESAIY